MICDSCANYVYDEDWECYTCMVNMDEDDYYRLMSGYQMTVLCANCKTIHRVTPPTFTPGSEEDTLLFLKELDVKNRLSRCPTCGARGHFQIWQPSDRCPNCRGVLTQKVIGLMVD